MLSFKHYSSQGTDFEGSMRGEFLRPSIVYENDVTDNPATR